VKKGIPSEGKEIQSASEMQKWVVNPTTPRHNPLRPITKDPFFPQSSHPNANHDFHKIKVSAGYTDKKVK
jgi:hypothetical protein